MQFGDYCTIEMAAERKPFTHKVIQRLQSNMWVEVPVKSPATETHHTEMEDVVRCVCCGICEDKIRRYRLADCTPSGIHNPKSPDFVVNP